MAPQYTVIAELRAQAAVRRVPAADSLTPSPELLKVQAESSLAAASLAGDLAGFLPDSCVAALPRGDVSMVDYVRTLRHTDPGRLRSELSEAFGCQVPLAWQPAMDEPQRWLQSLTAASIDAWETSIGHRWRRAGLAFDREIRRIGVATTRGHLDVVLNNLHPRLSYVAGELRFASGCGESYELGKRRLILVPMLTGAGTVMVSFDIPDIAYIAYPMRLKKSRSTPQITQSLALLVGESRACLLRVLQHEMSVGELAGHLGVTTSAVTYHCDQLVRAGMISRRQAGRYVYLSRTVRGDELVELTTS